MISELAQNAEKAVVSMLSVLPYVSICDYFDTVATKIHLKNGFVYDNAWLSVGFNVI